MTDLTSRVLGWHMEKAELTFWIERFKNWWAGRGSGQT
jgi:hypothetical protein